MDSVTIEVLLCLVIGVAIWLGSICYKSDRNRSDAEELKRENEKHAA